MGFSWKLADHPKLPKNKLVAMIVLDGWGEASPDNHLLYHVAETLPWDSLKTSIGYANVAFDGYWMRLITFEKFCYCRARGAPDHWRLVRAHGTAVGLPTEDDMGNSEVGHNALGARKGSLPQLLNSLIKLLPLGKFMKTKLLLNGASERGAKKIRVHVLTDGRDVLDGSSVGFAETLEAELASLRSKGIDAQVASGGGRMYVTMDRYENDWEVVKRGWDAQVLGEAPHKFKSAVEAIKTLRQAPGANDQYLPSFVIVDDSGSPVGPIVDGDAVVTVNFRADRMTMLAQALEYEKFDKFDRVRFPKIRYAGMLQYDGELKLPNHYLVSPPLIERTSGEYLVHNGVRTFACSETVKFGHVTFFWNGNRSGYFNSELEEYVEIPSDSGITFNVQPKMKALEIGEKTRDAILSGKFDQVRVNIPNGDMVGHTGDVAATVVACKAADEAVKTILDAVEQVGGIYVVTADHGNAEDMVKRNKKGEPILKDGEVQILTSHTLQPVPIAIGGPGLSAGVRFRKDVPSGGLANVAATVMNLHGFVAPEDTGQTL
ncbi:2,3-bisphosphoglycerate-independent phosphoglycerate mutase [Tanacetum coccineum]